MTERTSVIGRVLLLVFFTSILVLGLMQVMQRSAPIDPFAPYTDLLSRQQALEAIQNNRALFSCILVSRDTISCSFEPHDNRFSQILVSLRNNIPDHTSFSVVHEALRVGDLVALWGLPVTPLSSATSRLVWPEKDGVVARVFTAPASRVSYFTPVQLMLFTFVRKS